MLAYAKISIKDSIITKIVASILLKKYYLLRGEKKNRAGMRRGRWFGDLRVYSM